MSHRFFVSHTGGYRKGSKKNLMEMCLCVCVWGWVSGNAGYGVHWIFAFGSASHLPVFICLSACASSADHIPQSVSEGPFLPHTESILVHLQIAKDAPAVWEGGTFVPPCLGQKLHVHADMPARFLFEVSDVLPSYFINSSLAIAWTVNP